VDKRADSKSGASTRLRTFWRLPCLIIRLIIQTIRRDPSGSVWIDEALNVSRPDPSGTDQIDAEHQATDLAVGGFEYLVGRSIADRDARRRPGGARFAPGLGDSLHGVDNGSTMSSVGLDCPGAEHDRDRRRWLPSNEVTGGGLASRPGRARRPRGTGMATSVVVQVVQEDAYFPVG
jgi:hypothetical protein